MQLEKVYEPQRFEPHWAQWWIDRGFFHAPADPDPAHGPLALLPSLAVQGWLRVNAPLQGRLF